MPVAKVNGMKIETIEKQGSPDNLSIIQKAFFSQGASQCGFCIPGMVMAATSILRTNPNANIEEIKEEMEGIYVDALVTKKFLRLLKLLEMLFLEN